MRRVINLEKTKRRKKLGYRRTAKDQRVKVSVESSSSSINTSIDTELSNVDKGWRFDSDTEKSHSMTSESISSSDSDAVVKRQKRTQQET